MVQYNSSVIYLHVFRKYFRKSYFLDVLHLIEQLSPDSRRLDKYLRTNKRDEFISASVEHKETLEAYDYDQNECDKCDSDNFSMMRTSSFFQSLEN